MPVRNRVTVCSTLALSLATLGMIVAASPPTASAAVPTLPAGFRSSVSAEAVHVSALGGALPGLIAADLGVARTEGAISSTAPRSSARARNLVGSGITTIPAEALASVSQAALVENPGVVEAVLPASTIPGLPGSLPLPPAGLEAPKSSGPLRSSGSASPDNQPGPWMRPTLRSTSP